MRLCSARSLLVSVFCLLMFGLPHEGMAQSGRGAIAGTVTDTDGEPLAGANVTLPALDRGTATSPDGTFRIEGLPARTLTVRFSFVGYASTVREVDVPGGGTAEVTVQLSAKQIQSEEVTVTGTATTQSTLTSPQDVDVLGAETMQAEPTAALGDLLQASVSGVSSVQTGSQAGKPVLRGLTGNRIVLLKDGIAQEYYQFGVRHFPTTSASEAERIEVVRGASSLLYGSDALGGAINVITKAAPSTQPGQTLIGGKVEGQYFTNNDERALRAEMRAAQGGVGVRAGVERRVAASFTAPDVATFQPGDGATSQPYGPPKYAGTVPNTNFDQWSGYAQVGWTGDFGSVQLYGDTWADTHNFLLPMTDDGGAVGVGQNLQQRNLILKGTLPLGEFVLKPRLAYQRALRQSAGAGRTTETIDGSFDWPVDLAKNVYTARVELLHPDIVSGLSGTVGVDASVQDGASRGAVQLEPGGTVAEVGVFAFEEWTRGPVTLSGGLRFDYRRQTADPFASARQALGLTEADLTKTYPTVSGSIGANWQVTDGVALVGNFGTGFRAPSLFELYANGIHGGVAARQQGNPDLDPERAYTVDASVRVRRGIVKGEVTAYQNAFANYIYLDNTGEQSGNLPIFSSAQTPAVIRGVESSLTLAPTDWLELGAETSVLASEGEALDDFSGSTGSLPLIPASTIGGHVRLSQARLGPLQNTFVEGRVRHAFAKDAAGAYEPFAQFDNRPFGTASTEAYTTLRLKAGSTLRLAGNPITLSIGVRNLTNVAYRNFLDTYKGYALSPGRDVTFSLTIPFETTL